MKRSDIINLQELWFHTDKGRIVFERELGKIPNKCINSPLRTDKNPSFSLFQDSNGFWRWKDFSNGESGNAIDFIMKRYNKSYPEALKYINEGITANPVSNVKNNSKTVKRSESIIEFSTQPFTEAHKKYWGQYGLDEEFLNNYNVWAVKAWSRNEKLQKIPKDTIVTAYFCEELDKVKLLFIGDSVKKENKWRNTVPNNYIWFLPENKCEKLWVMKSVKDALVMRKHFNNFCAVAVQNESAAILDENMPKLLNLVENPKDLVIFWGSDPQGVEQCKQVQQKYKCSYFNTPKYLVKHNIVDSADVISEFGVEVLRKELKKKKFL